MGRKHAKLEEIIPQLSESDVRLSQGERAAHATRAIGVSEQVYYRWRREYAGMKIDQDRSPSNSGDAISMRSDLMDLLAGNSQHPKRISP